MEFLAQLLVLALAAIIPLMGFAMFAIGGYHHASTREHALHPNEIHRRERLSFEHVTLGLILVGFGCIMLIATSTPSSRMGLILVGGGLIMSILLYRIGMFSFQNASFRSALEANNMFRLLRTLTEPLTRLIR